MSIKTTSWITADKLNFLPEEEAGSASVAIPRVSLLQATTSSVGGSVELTGTEITLDESLGLQNAALLPVPPEITIPAGDADDNDTALALPTVFQTALAGQTAVGPMLEAALSGHDGTNAGANMITVTPSTTGQIPELGFALAAGDGTDSGLIAIFLGTEPGEYAYRKVFLYTDPLNDNIVYGRAGWDGVEGPDPADTPLDPSDDTANPDGQVVFALYLEETGSPVTTGAMIWSVRYAPLKHPDPGSYDEPVDLTDKVYISAKTDFEVDLYKAPSGQNLFLMFTKTDPETYDDAGITRISDPVIIATGMNPANQSEGIKITEGDTINTSKGGGPTTFGTNNQMIVEGEGVRFSFVTGARQDVTVPNLDQNEADIESNIDFTGVFDVNQAQFDVVQLQSGKSAVVKISAYSTDAEPGVGFVDGYADDTPVNITGVTVWKDGVEQTLTVDLDGDTAVIYGVTAGCTIEYTTTATHNRVLVSNAGSGEGKESADFDIGGFKLLDIIDERVEIGSKINFEDDGPGGGLEPPAPPSGTSDFSDQALENGIPQTLTITPPLDFLAGAQTGLENPTILSSSYAFTPPADLASYPKDSGLLDTFSGNKIWLYWDITTAKSGSTEGDADRGDGVIVGRVGNNDDTANASGDIAFQWTVDTLWDGLEDVPLDPLDVHAWAHPTSVRVTMAQYRPILHDNPLDPVEGALDAIQQTVVGEIFTLVRTDTIIDADGDTVPVISDPVIVSESMNFTDDGPSFDTDTTAVPTLITDDSDIPDSAGPADFSVLFSPDYGQDGALDPDHDNADPQVPEESDQAIQYALGVKNNGTNVASGLYDTLTGLQIVLNKETDAVLGDVVVGRAGAAGAVVFTISVDADTGDVSLEQVRAIVHDDINDHDEANDDGTAANDDAALDDAAIQQTLAADLVTLTATITDGDGDTAQDTRDIGAAFRFLDDGPELDFGNLVGTGTLESQYGAWSKDPGKDGMATLGVTLEHFYLVNGGQQAGTSFTFEETATPGLYEGTLTGDFDHDANTDDNTVGFNLEVKDDGSYVFNLLDTVESEIKFSSADGKLDAGGPDPVRTLTIPETAVPPDGEQIVFFGVQADADPADILDAIGDGEPDLTEAQIEANAYDFLGTANMNVSTSGIGVGNNNMNGNTNPDPEDGDESFVVNPETLLTKVTVYIDNSVQGYDPATETLYYRIFYEDGTSTAHELVGSGDLNTYNWAPEFAGDTKTATEKLVDGLQYFEITADWSNMIDAVQITMGQGVTKIPVIEFTKGVEVVASNIQLDFTATLTDGDGDWATSDFSVNLFANDLDTTPDFTMQGTTAELDYFNVDLTELVGGSYGIIQGFDDDLDELLLLGDAGALYAIDTSYSPGDTRITVTESDADTTIIDVVGVELEANDIMIIG